jgi:hypothetical protein
MLRSRFVTPNVQAQERCADLLRSAPWSAVLGFVESCKKSTESIVNHGE